LGAATTFFAGSKPFGSTTSKQATKYFLFLIFSLFLVLGLAIAGAPTPDR
jgi:hypothetical protein